MNTGSYNTETTTDTTENYTETEPTTELFAPSTNASGISSNKVTTQQVPRSLDNNIIVKKNTSAVKNEGNSRSPPIEEIICLNGGKAVSKTECKCSRGFTGTKCERSLCDINYCFKGDCYTSSLGFLQCKCPSGYAGSRCERNICDNFCLNDGLCQVATSSDNGTAARAVCQCKEGYFGNRCERNGGYGELCSKYCLEKESGAISGIFDGYECRLVYFFNAI